MIVTVELLRSNRAFGIEKSIRIYRHNNFNNAISYILSMDYSDGQIIEPSTKGANHCIEKWFAEFDSLNNPYNAMLFSSKGTQVFIINTNEQLKVTGVYSKDIIALGVDEVLNKKIKVKKYHRRVSEKEIDNTLKKRSYYKVGYHYPKNNKLRAMDYPKDVLIYSKGYRDEDNYCDESYDVKMPSRILSCWDAKYSNKYWKPGHVSWKNQKNRKQWMKNKPSHKDTFKIKEVRYLDPWDLYIADLV